MRLRAGSHTHWPQEVGTDGKLGNQAEVPGGQPGTWKDLTDHRSTPWPAT